MYFLQFISFVRVCYEVVLSFFFFASSECGVEYFVSSLDEFMP